MYDEFSPEWSTETRDVSMLQGLLPCVAQMEGVLGDLREDVTQALGPLLLLAARNATKVEALFKDQQKHKDQEQEEPRLVIPLSYPGWWQVLPDEDQNDATVDDPNSSGGSDPWITIQEAAQANPTEILTITDVQAYYLVQHYNRGPKFYARTILHSGEVFSVQGACKEVVTMTPKSSCYAFIKRIKKLKSRKQLEKMYMRCRDSVGKELLLSFEEKGVFYEVGSVNGSLAVNAVYQLKDLITKRTKPLRLKLVKGEPPPIDDSSFTGVVTVDQVYSEEAIIGCTILQEKPMLVEFPLDSEIQFSIAENWDELESTNYVQATMGYYEEYSEAYSQSIKTLQNVSNSTEDDKSDRCSTPISPRLKPKGSFLMRNRELPPLPEKIHMKRKSAWELLKEKRKSILSLLPKPEKLDRAEHDPNYEKIPFYYHQKALKKLSTGTLSSCETLSECNTKYEETPVLPRKSVGMYPRDEDGYLLPSEAQEQLQEYRRQISSCQILQNTEEIGQEPIYNNQSSLLINTSEEKELEGCMDAIVFSDNIPDDSIPMFDSERLDSFLLDTMQELERKLSCRKHYADVTEENLQVDLYINKVDSEIFEHLETVEAIDEYLEQIFGACEISSDESSVFDVKPQNIGVQRSLSLDTGSQMGKFPDSHSEPYGHFLGLNRSLPNDSGIYLSHMASAFHLSDTDNDSMNFYRSFSECSWCPPEDISTLSVEEVALSLRYIGMRHSIVARFCEEQMDGKQMSDITEDVLKEAFPELNVLERKKILDFVSGWRPKRWV